MSLSDEDRQPFPDRWKTMWIFFFLMAYSFMPDDVSGQEMFPAAPAIVVNLTLESEDGSYVDSRQISVTIVPTFTSTTTATPTTADPNSIVIPHTWQWTTYTAWSECTTTCGAGLQFAERWCVMVTGRRVVQAAATVDPCLEQDMARHPNITTATSAAAAGQPSQKQYRRCEKQPCPVTYHSPPPASANEIDTFGQEDLEPDFPTAEPGDLRFQLCSLYDEKEFAGDRKYTWIPFLTGYAPCALLCRPVEEKFYVSFAERVPDGLTCERITTDTGDLDGHIVASVPGVCLNGTCQVRCE